MSRIARARLNGFLDMLAAERGAARNTLDAYQRDIDDYLEFLGGRALDAVAADDIRAWLADVSARGLKASSAARRLSAVRQFHRFLYTEGFSPGDPSAAIEGPVIAWVADHRKHHAFTDVEGDPHSPHVDHGHGWKGAMKALR